MPDEQRAEIQRLLAATQAKLNRTAVTIGQRPGDAELQERFTRLVSERDTLEALLREPDWTIPY